MATYTQRLLWDKNPYDGGFETRAAFIDDHQYSRVDTPFYALSLHHRHAAMRQVQQAIVDVGWSSSFEFHYTDAPNILMTCPAGIWKDQKAKINVGETYHDLSVEGFDQHTHKYGNYLCMNTLYLQNKGINEWWKDRSASKYNLECYTLQQILCAMINFMVWDTDLDETYRCSGLPLIADIMKKLEKLEMVNNKYISPRKFLLNIWKAILAKDFNVQDLTTSNIHDLFDDVMYIAPKEDKPSDHEIFMPLRFTRDWTLSVFNYENERAEYAKSDPPNGVISIEKKKRDLTRAIKNAKSASKLKNKTISLTKIKRNGGVFVLSKLNEYLDTISDDNDYYNTSSAQEKRFSDLALAKVNGSKTTKVVFTSKRMAKESQAFMEYSVMIPEQMPRMSAYKERGNQLNINANLWFIYRPIDDPCWHDEAFNLMIIKYFDGLSRSFFRLPTQNQFKSAYDVSNIIAKSMIKQISDCYWRPSQSFLEIVLTMGNIFKYITMRDEDIRVANMAVIQSLELTSRVDKSSLPDLSYSMFIIIAMNNHITNPIALYTGLLGEALSRMALRGYTKINQLGKTVKMTFTDFNELINHPNCKLGLRIMANVLTMINFIISRKTATVITDAEIERLQVDICASPETKFYKIFGYDILKMYNLAEAPSVRLEKYDLAVSSNKSVNIHMALPVSLEKYDLAVQLNKPANVSITPPVRLEKINAVNAHGNHEHICHLCKRTFTTVGLLKATKKDRHIRPKRANIWRCDIPQTSAASNGQSAQAGQPSLKAQPPLDPAGGFVVKTRRKRRYPYDPRCEIIWSDAKKRSISMLNYYTKGKRP